MSKKVIVSGSMIPSSSNLPLDLRTRINTISEVSSIELPFVGMIFYVLDEEKFYVVKSLKNSFAGSIELKNTVVDEFEPLMANVNIDLDGLATEDFVREQINQIESIPGPEGPQGPQGEQGPAGKDGKDAEPVDLTGLATEEFVKEQIANAQINGGDCDCAIDLSEFARKEFVKEAIANIEHPQYDDSELREMFIVDEPKKATFNNRPYVFACGYPVLVEGKDEEVVITYSVNDTNKNVGEIRMSIEEAKKLVIVGGFSNENINKTRVLPATNIHIRNVDIQAVYGGHLFNGDVGEANIVIENSSVKEIVGGGDASRAIDKKFAVRNNVSKINVKLNNVKSTLVYVGGAGGPSTVGEARMEFNGACNIGWLTAGGSNGFTAKSEIVINGGEFECVQMTNRGLVDEAKLVMNDGHIKRAYFAGEAEDESVTGVINQVVFELNKGQINKLARGNSNSIEFNGDIKGHIMNCVVAEGDVSMLEVKAEEEIDVNIDLSEYAKIEFVEEQIANIELKEGPQGPVGESGISVVNVIIENNHLKVELSDGQILDAGELPAGQGGGGAVNPELEKELAETKQQLLDLTYGVEYEYIYFDVQDAAAETDLKFDPVTAPKFFEEYNAAIDAGQDEDFIMSMYEQDIYRMYILRIASDHRTMNRYEMIPIEDSEVQPNNDYISSWNPVKNISSWNWTGDTDGGFTINQGPTSAMVFAFMKVKEEYRGKF